MTVVSGSKPELGNERRSEDGVRIFRQLGGIDQKSEEVRPGSVELGMQPLEVRGDAHAGIGGQENPPGSAPARNQARISSRSIGPQAVVSSGRTAVGETM